MSTGTGPHTSDWASAVTVGYFGEDVDPNPSDYYTVMGEGGGGGPFDPVELADLRVWLKGDTLTGLTDGAPVTSWPDAAPGGVALAAPAGKEPIYQAAAINGLPGVHVDETVGQYVNASVTWNANGVTVFFVGKHAGGNRFAGLNDAYPRFGVPEIFCGAAIRFDAPIPVPIIDTYIYNGPDSAIRRDGQEMVRGDAGGTGVLAPARNVTVGASNSLGEQPWSGDICEFLCYSRVLTDAELKQVEGYLTGKYGA